MEIERTSDGIKVSATLRVPRIRISLEKTHCHFTIGSALNEPCGECGERQRGDCPGVGSFETIYEGCLEDWKQREIVRIIKSDDNEE